MIDVIKGKILFIKWIKSNQMYPNFDEIERYSCVMNIFYLFSTFGTVMFNLGSMLLWALGRTVAPENSILRTMMGVAGATGAIYLGRSYVVYLDSHNKST